MKIILCTFLLCITAVSVFGQSVELNGILGENVKFPAAVKKDGFLIHSSITIGEVTSSSFGTPRNENYRDRLQWDSSTGLFSLSGLKMEDIGEYKVQNTDQNIDTFFQLNVYTVSVFGKELNRIVEGSVKFLAEVKKDGFLIHSSITIGEVTSGSFRALRNEKFSSRLQWDSSTGFFSLSGLTKEDSGEYKVQNTDQNIITVFQLNVYIPVSKPNVTFISKEYPCTLNCTVESGTQGTLLWYRDGEKKSSYESSFSIAPHWHTFQAVLGSGNYTCEVNNSVSNNKTSVYLEDDCRGGAAGIWQTEGSKMWSLCLVLIVMLCSRLV